ncbi:HPC2 [Candida jiufengensis]|uniref:HPC2 n=1 Tax=Candida jiufengensis TaxID=497108 RepID=UPI0022240B67|nr:HPC2 [Candida jiufengensis]KAI5954596.1 HPC2 [Candida jiufengensis]
MSSGNKNVSISSLLSSNTNETTTNNLARLQPKPTKAIKDPKEVKQSSLKRLLSRYQTTFDAQDSPEPIEQTSSTNNLILKNSLNKSNTTNLKSPSTNSTNSRSRSISKSPSASLTTQLKKFQTEFQVGPITAPKPKSKTSINSIINLDDDENDQINNTSFTPSQSADILMNHNLLKWKKPSGTNGNDNKRRKINNGELQQSPNITSKLKNDTTNIQPVKKGIYSGMTTEKSENKGPPVKLSAPTVIDLLNPEEDEEEDLEIMEDDNQTKPNTVSTPTKPQSNTSKKELSLTDKQQSKEKIETPIIALNIPLLDPKNPQPGKAEVVVNVLKLAEEKYGWSVIHPKAKSAIDIMDDMIDDEEDDDQVDDDNDEDEEQDNSKPIQQQRGKELTEEQLVRQHEIKMIRKVGKYDFEDPFIDDFELQMEEEISTTKEGFFVYWGPLIDDRNNSTNKKGSKKK